MLTAGEIDRATHDADRAIYVNALALRGRLEGARRVALGAVLRNLEHVAAAGGLTPTRLPALFQTVARNRQWWSNGPLLRNGARVSFEGSRLVWQHYAGEGLQIQWLGTFGKANGLWQGGYDASLRALLDEALPLAAQRAGGIAWEYLFRFDGGAPPWVSGLAQGTAVQALARAAVRLAEPRYSEAARAALGIFREPPPSGVRIATPAGAHYLIYSFAPNLRVLNAFTQALNGLHDFAALAGDADGHALFAAGEAQLRGELARYDTGAWTRYSLAPRGRPALPQGRARLPRQPLRAADRGRRRRAGGAATGLTRGRHPRGAPAGHRPRADGRRRARRGAAGGDRSHALLRRGAALDAVPLPAAGRQARLAPRARRQARHAEAHADEALQRDAAAAARRAHGDRARRAARQRRAHAALAAPAARRRQLHGPAARPRPRRQYRRERGAAAAAAGAARAPRVTAAGRRLAQTVVSSRTSVRRKLFPDGSRKPESMPYGRSSGASVNSTPRALSSS